MATLLAIITLGAAGVILWIVSGRLSNATHRESGAPKLVVDPGFLEKLRSPHSRSPRGFPRLSNEPVRIRAMGDRMRKDRGEPDWDEKQVDDLFIACAIHYKNAQDDHSFRLVVIDGLYGYSLTDIIYFYGFDSKSGERRTFRTDRVQTLSTIDSVDENGNASGKIIEGSFGKLLAEEAIAIAGGNPLLIDESEGVLISAYCKVSVRRISDRKIERLDFEIKEYFYDGPEFGVTMIGYAKRARDIDRGIRGWSGKKRVNSEEIIELIDSETGEIVEDLLSWVREKAAAERTDKQIWQAPNETD